MSKTTHDKGWPDVYMPCPQCDGEGCDACEGSGIVENPDYTTEDDMSTQTTPDTPFDPEAEGWEREPNYNYSRWNSPSGAWQIQYFIADFDTHWSLFSSVYRGQPRRAWVCTYHGSHPTRSLVHEIIRLNGGDNE